MVREAPLGVGERHLEEVGEVDVELGEVRAGRDETVEEPVRLRTRYKYPAFSLAVYNRTFPSMEANYPYAIKFQRGASKIP